jgi:hypothetical protein
MIIFLISWDENPGFHEGFPKKPLFVPQSIDRIEPAGSPSRVETKADTDASRED